MRRAGRSRSLAAVACPTGWGRCAGDDSTARLPRQLAAMAARLAQYAHGGPWRWLR
jgi:hypothetical protein